MPIQGRPSELVEFTPALPPAVGEGHDFRIVQSFMIEAGLLVDEFCFALIDLAVEFGDFRRQPFDLLCWCQHFRFRAFGCLPTQRAG
jgi:hypothetical protein